MVRDADKVLEKHFLADPAAAEEWRITGKLKNDPRRTHLGNVLHKSHLDELPQLFNVLRGDMKLMELVSPRTRLFWAMAVLFVAFSVVVGLIR